MIQNAIGEVMELAHIKQLADLVVANGNKILTYDSKENHGLSHAPCFTSSRQYLEDRSMRYIHCYSVTMILITHMIKVTMINTNRTKLIMTSWRLWLMLSIPINLITILEVIVKLQTVSHLPDWIKMTQEQCDQLIAKRNQERLARAKFKIFSTSSTCQHVWCWYIC
jgi:hypothetical protein